MARTYVVLIIIALVVGVAIGQSGNRFSELTRQHIDGASSDYEHVTILHDRDSGQEVVCFYRYQGYSSETGCWPTGRNWK